jgi:hypothetical protein
VKHGEDGLLDLGDERRLVNPWTTISNRLLTPPVECNPSAELGPEMRARKSLLDQAVTICHDFWLR